MTPIVPRCLIAINRYRICSDPSDPLNIGHLAIMPILTFQSCCFHHSKSYIVTSAVELLCCLVL